VFGVVVGFGRVCLVFWCEGDFGFKEAKYAGLLII